MSSFQKLLDMFRHLKSDAVPRPPRPNNANERDQHKHENNENIDPCDTSNEPEEIIVESDDDDVETKQKPKYEKTFSKPSKKQGKPPNDNNGNSYVNTQASGNVINIVNSQGIRWGNDYYMGPTKMAPNNNHFRNVGPDDDDDEVEQVIIKKSNKIKLLLKAPIKPEHIYINHISKNLGKKWQNFYLTLGFSKNAIETMVIDTEKYGVTEARYKLLLAWIEKEEDPSLGRLATHLWEDGETQLVKELAFMYKDNKA